MTTVLEAMNKLRDELAGLGRDIRALRDAMQPGADPGDEHREAPMPPCPHCGKADAVELSASRRSGTHFCTARKGGCSEFFTAPPPAEVAEAVRVLKDEPHPMPDCVHDWERVPDPSGNNDSCYACRRCGRCVDNRPTPAEQPAPLAAVRELVEASAALVGAMGSTDLFYSLWNRLGRANIHVAALLPTLRLLPEGHVAVPRGVVCKAEQYCRKDGRSVTADRLRAALKETP